MTATMSLEAKARSLIDSSTRAVSSTDDETDERGSPSQPTRTFTFPLPCSGLDGSILESTTTLSTARALSKIGRSDLSWEFLRTLFAAQGSNGFIPRYVYLNGGGQPFVGPYPGPALFDTAPNDFTPPSSLGIHNKQATGHGVNISSSNTIMAPPFHATAVLETFYLSNQTHTDVQHLGMFYTKLQQWHGYLHRQTISKCIESTDDVPNGEQHTYYPCLIARHPWETEIDTISPLWEAALKNVTTIVKDAGWIPSFDVSDAVKTSFDYPGDQLYESFLYLQQCLSETQSTDSTKDETKQQSTSHDNIQSACPFAMIDIGFTSALSKSDVDLQQIRQILIDKNYIAHPSWEEIELYKQRIHTSKNMLRRLWDEEKGTFFNRIVNFELNENGTYSSKYTTPLEVPIGYNFMALWEQLSNATMIERMSSHMLQRSGEYSYSCGDYPLWSVGGCGQAFDTGVGPSPPIMPLLNYRVSRGLKRNQDVGLGQYIGTSTLNMICGLPNSDESGYINCSHNLLFSTAFNASTHLPLGKDACGLTSTLSAAIALDLISPDKTFRYESEPPISSSSVIILIAVEMVLAFGVGVVCLVLSLSLMRRANADEEGDGFFQIVPEEEPTALDLYQQEENNSPESFELSNGIEEFGIWTWSSGMLSRLNPMNMLGGTHETNQDEHR